MKYSEFKAEVEKLGLHIGVYESHIDVFGKLGDTVSRVAKDVEMSIDTEYEDFKKLPQGQRAAVFEALYKLAKTPLAEREEEKRYRLLYVTPPLLRRELMAPEYLYIRRCDGYIDTSLSAEDDPAFKTIFTESEISKMDITGFKKEPVE